ncbi:MAG TPA: PQQ-dependent sugar dehydrogenase [Bacteriovoracaceae bacterium]|nr:PQQ-dependent sugar dehydrogenase [Bacteriovoracaceae bacterium]
MKTLMILLVSLFTSYCAFTSKTTSAVENRDFKVEDLHSKDETIWGFDFLPGDRIIFSERSGKMMVLDLKTKKTTEVQNVPKVYAVGQGGLLDVRVHPEFKQNGLIFFSYSETVGTLATTAVMRAKLTDNKLSENKKIFTGHAPNDNDIHFGSRIEFDGRGHLFISMGDRDNREKAQDLSFHQGKVLRLSEDGSVPKDNPFTSDPKAKPEIWSFGHRNAQGLTRHPVTNEIWEAEMGPRGGDEINVLTPGKNYGWPMITYGREYYGPKIGEKSKAGMEQPLVYWVPSISPSNIAFYWGDKFPAWKHNLFIATLSGNHLRRLVLDGHKVISQEKLLGELDYRFRNVRTGPDGFVYLSTDEGKILRLVPR